MDSGSNSGRSSCSISNCGRIDNKATRKTTIDKKWRQLIKKKPLLPDGHKIVLRVTDCHNERHIKIKCRTYFYDPVFEILKLDTTDNTAMCAYFQMFGSSSRKLTIDQINGVKLLQLRWSNGQQNDHHQHSTAEQNLDDRFKIKLYFKAQYDQADEDRRREMRKDLSEQDYIALIEKFDKVMRKFKRHGVKPCLNKIHLKFRAATIGSQANVHSDSS